MENFNWHILNHDQILKTYSEVLHVKGLREYYII